MGSTSFGVGLAAVVSTIATALFLGLAASQPDRDGGSQRVLVCRALKWPVLVSETEMDGAGEYCYLV